MPHIEIVDHKLSNGLRVVICPRNTAPVVNVTVMYGVGSHDEHRGKTGLAHLFEHLMFDNTTSGNTKQYDLYCAKAGGSNNAYTTYDYTTYYINLPSHQLSLGLWLEAERMRGFNITDHALSTQRSVVIEEIHQNVLNQPYAQWREKLQNTAFSAKSSYSWDVYGSVADVDSVKMEDAHSFFASYYQPANAVLCIAGNVEVSEALALAKEHFGEIQKAEGDIIRTAFNDSFKQYGATSVLHDAIPVQAAFVSFHLPGVTKDELLESDVIATVLGQGKSSALYNQMVRTSRLASTVGAFVDKRKHASLLTMYAYAATPDTTAAEMAEMLTFIAQNLTISEEQHQGSVNRMRMSYAAELQRVSGLAENVAWTTLHWNNPQYILGGLEKFNELSLEKVHRVHNTYIKSEKPVTVLVVPHKEEA